MKHDVMLLGKPTPTLVPWKKLKTSSFWLASKDDQYMVLRASPPVFSM
jgi:hypothetical protein